MTDKHISTLILTLEKAIIKDYAVAITEASTKELGKKFIKFSNDSIELQREIFNYMSDNGWYQLPQAQQEKIQQEATKLTNKCQNF